MKKQKTEFGSLSLPIGSSDLSSSSEINPSEMVTTQGAISLATPNSKQKLPPPKSDRCANIFSTASTLPEFCANRGGRTVRIFKDTTYQIDVIHTVQRLVNDAFTTTKKATVCLRFLLSKDFELLFALEGTPSPMKGIPGHGQMTGAQKPADAWGVSAGNIEFNANLQIVKINHKSGDFKPTFDSLQWVLAVMVAKGMAMQEELLIEALDTSEGHRETYSLNCTDIKEFVKSRFQDPILLQMKEANNRQIPKFHEYKSTGTSKVEFTKIAVRRPMFDDNSPVKNPSLQDAELKEKTLQSEGQLLPSGSESSSSPFSATTTPKRTLFFSDSSVTPKNATVRDPRESFELESKEIKLNFDNK